MTVLAIRQKVIREDDLQKMASKLTAFFERYGLSLRDVERLCGGPAVLSKSTLHRLVKADVERQRALSMAGVLREALGAFLKTKKLKAREIQAEMDGLFPSQLTPLYCDPSVTYDGLSTWREKLDAFRRRHNLNYYRLWLAAGGDAICSHKVVKQLCTGELVRFEHKLKPVMRMNLLRFLIASGVSEEEAATEIATVFDIEGEIMFAPRTTLHTEALDFFKLRRDPFTDNPRSRAEVFTTPQIDRVAGQVEDAINYQGFVVVLGEIGSGKSLLKRRTVETVEQSNGRMRLFFPEFFNMDRVHSGSIVTYLLRALDQPVPSDLVMRAAKLKQVLANLSENGVHVALGFDECHQLHDRLLTALKNFWELGSGGYDRFLGVVLWGQPQFEGRLRDHRFREICERIEMLNMPSFEKCAWDYIAHRVRLAGGDAEKLFDREAVKLIVKQFGKQGPTPLALGNLCNAALLKAYSMNERKVVSALIQSESNEPTVRAVRRAS